MLRYVLFALLIIILASGAYYILSNKKVYPSDETTLANGKTLFTKNCMSCHSLKDDGIGPPLGGITKLLSQKNLSDFITDPSKQIASTNQRAMMLHARYKQTMPSFNWMKKEEINSILSYINKQTELHHIEVYKMGDHAVTNFNFRRYPLIAMKSSFYHGRCAIRSVSFSVYFHIHS